MRLNCFKETSDDWYGNFRIADDMRFEGKRFVYVSFFPFQDGSGWRVCVWGNDDLGMEIDFASQEEEAAREFFVALCLKKIISRDDLEKMGFVRA